jgi:hypothetical protein
MQLSIADLTPTLKDVQQVLDALPSSACGPDGIPFAAYAVKNPAIAQIIHEVALAMLEGCEGPPEVFNQAFLLCLPKATAGTTDDGEDYVLASGTRPLSIVDSINRILASIFRVLLERHTTKWISSMQRGFIAGRSMINNVVDIDFAAQKVSIQSKRGAILLLDFKAAFPSMSHDGTL